MTLRLVGVIQARLGSTRLPRKVLADVGGRTVLEHVVRAARRAVQLDDLVVAIPAGDTELAAESARLGVRSISGDTDDVLGRFVTAARATEADAVLRLTADCPLLDAHIVDQVAAIWRDRRADYVFIDGYPRGVGDAEIIDGPALFTADAESTERYHREHVMTYHVDNPDRFDLEIRMPPPKLHRPDLRVCVDEPDDLRAVRMLWNLIQTSGLDPTARSIIELLDAHPEIASVNRDVRQKQI